MGYSDLPDGEQRGSGRKEERHDGQSSQHLQQVLLQAHPEYSTIVPSI